jgi:hypothetical protein
MEPQSTTESFQFKTKLKQQTIKMGRHHDRKYGITPFGAASGNHRTYTHVTHKRRQKKQMKRMANTQRGWNLP